MEINPLGLFTGVTIFFGVWLGHVTVRKVEAAATKLWLPMAISLLLGISFELGAVLINLRALSMVCGIAGMTLLWDALEFRRQEQRVRRGHAPANPANPRHAAILAEPGSAATTVDVLNCASPESRRTAASNPADGRRGA